MRICIFAMMLPVHYRGGMEFHAWDLCKALADRGHEVTVITGKHPAGKKEERTDGIRIFYVGNKATSTYPFSYWRESAKKMEELAKRGERFDAVHTHSVSAFGYILRQRKAHIIASMHGTELSEIKSVLQQKMSLRKAVDLCVFAASYPLIGHTFYRRVSKLVVPTENMAEELINFYRIPKRKVAVLHYGIDTAKFSKNNGGARIRKIFGIRKGEKLVLAASRLIEEKGVQYFLEAFPRILEEVGNVRLMVAGDGPYKAELEQIAKRLAIEDKVIFCTNTHDELPDFYNACDVFVSPSLRVAGLPLVVLEAMSCGKPVIASRSPEMKTAIQDGVDGFLVYPHDASLLAEKTKLLLNSRALAADMGKNARKKIIAEFSIDVSAKKLESIFERAASGGYA